MMQPTENIIYNALPSGMRESMAKVLNGDIDGFLNAAPEPEAVRINTLRANVRQMTKRLRDWGVDVSPHPFNPTGLILQESEARYTHTLEYFGGKIHGQGVSSQIPVLALDPQPGERVLDMAASPGSKSTQIAALMRNKGQLLLCDPSPKRQQALLTNLARAGILNDVYLQMPGQRMGRLFHEYFDRVLLDAPCSATSKLPGQQVRAQWVWTESAFQTLLNTQYQLLVSAIKAAKPGGVIVYSTCTLTIQENEALLDRVLREYPVQLDPVDWLNGASIHHGVESFNGKTFHPDMGLARRIIPGERPMEAFFMARLIKMDSIPAKGWRRKIGLIRLKSAFDPEISPVLDYISSRWDIPGNVFDRFRFHLTSKRLWICSPDWYYMPEEMFVKAGLALAVRRTNVWKLTSSGAQLLGNLINDNVIELEEKELVNLFKNGRMNYDSHKNGYYALRFRNEIIGGVSVMAGVIKISLPHQFDLLL